MEIRINVKYATSVKKDQQNLELIIEKAVAVFTSINQKIKSLIDCSARDFDTLNQSFKEYHTTIKDLSEKATLLFKSSNEVPIEKINHQLALFDLMQNRYKKAYANMLEIDRYIINLINDTSYSCLHFNNLKQNISTLKLLTTNIQLEPYYRKLYKNLIVTINNLSDCCQKFDIEFQFIGKQLNAGFEIIDQIKNQHFVAVFQTIERMHKALSELASKKSVCLGYDTTMNELLSRKSVSSSEIITNLQFQDIIRQKIEHVQLAHEALLEQLHDFNFNQKTSIKDRFELTLEIIFQIRNIGSLQAAQLIHANSEYQKAVKNITEKFGDLDFVLDETMRLLNIFLSSGDSIEEYFYKEFDEVLSAYQLSSETFHRINYNLHEMFTDFFNKTDYFNSVVTSFNYSINSINSIFDELKVLKDNQESNALAVDIISQILVNFNEFRSNSQNLCKILDRNISEIQDKLIPTFREYFSILHIASEDSEQFSSSIKTLIPEGLTDLINKKNYPTEKEIYAAKFNIGDIEYYKIFEKEVDEIISNLNQLIDQINFDEIEDKISSENLDKLKKMYTMKSERDVHAAFTGNKLDKKDSDNEIELF